MKNFLIEIRFYQLLNLKQHIRILNILKGNCIMKIEQRLCLIISMYNDNTCLRNASMSLMKLLKFNSNYDNRMLSSI